MSMSTSATGTGTSTAMALTRTVEDAINANAGLLDGLAEQLQGWIRGLVESQGEPGQKAKDALNGVWLGHALHPALTDVPIGAWACTAVLDLVGQPDAADAALAIGIAAAVPTALAGAADWVDTGGQQRRNGLAHALLNSVALGCMAGSLAARRADQRGLGLLLSTAGLSIGTLSAWIGGELVYRLGVAVDRNAWVEPIGDFAPAAKLADLEDGQLTGVDVRTGDRSERVVLLKRGDEVLAFDARCSHMGGPLDEGSLEGDTVQCPWHGSRFDVRSGAVRQGPATAPVPTYETRVREGTVEVRSAG
jgi:nitrite reductase/ring-hydroxylating ferredoxin subunit/uncharacterized membrane protein